MSTIAAVSAFEAHAINVTAHIENALDVDIAEVAFGTVFPEEFLNPNPPKDTDGRREESGRGVRELQGK